jgi:hypothetical protein
VSNKPPVEVLCENPDHYQVHPDQTSRAFWRPTGRGYAKTRYCDKACKTWVRNHFRSVDGMLVRIVREYGTTNALRYGPYFGVEGSWDAAKKETQYWYKAARAAGLSHKDAKEFAKAPERPLSIIPYTLSTDMALAFDDVGVAITLADFAATNGRSTAQGGPTMVGGGPSPLVPNPTDAVQEAAMHTIPSTVLIPLEPLGFPGIAARLTYGRGGTITVPTIPTNPTTIYHDHVEVDIIREDDGVRMSTAHPDAPGIVGMYQSGALMAFCKDYIEGLRVAAATGYDFEGAEPASPPDASSVALLDRN